MSRISLLTKPFVSFFLIVLFCARDEASPATDYVSRFTNYLSWHQNQPETASETFLAFIQQKTPLANKLREKWLYQLGQKKDWANYQTFYQPSADINLQCLNLEAAYYLGAVTKAFEGAKILWLSPESLSPVCNQLFSLFLKEAYFDESLLEARIRLSLAERNIALASFLLKSYKTPHFHEEKTLQRLYQNPKRLNEIAKGPLQGDYYLYALKRLVPIDMKLAIKKAAAYSKWLSLKESQDFIAHVALYKAMKNQKDAYLWFASLKPEFYNDSLLDWQIRAALKDQDWPRVVYLINQTKDKDSPCWRYWLARAKESLKQPEEARAIYTKLSEDRNYYGFLASVKRHTAFSFKEEKPKIDLKKLAPYHSILDIIQSAYLSGQISSASRLLTDFMSELPEEDKASLVYWLNKELNWTAKAVALTQDKAMADHLGLRFPLANQKSVALHARNFGIPMALVYSVIRQESEFGENVESSAGARGLMQLMPDTAAMVARLEHIHYSSKAELFSREKNIHLGVAYLGYLAKRFDNHALLMTAAYNAGPGQLKYWLKNHSPKEVDIWIETLPWHETRNYLKNIIAFYAVYQYRLKLKPELSLFLRPFAND